MPSIEIKFFRWRGNKAGGAKKIYRIPRNNPTHSGPKNYPFCEFEILEDYT